jgi:protease-4
MNYLFLKDIVSSPWQVDANTFRSLLPIFRGFLAGASIEKAEEPDYYKPYAISATDKSTVMGYYADDQPELMDQEPEKEKVVNVLPIRSVLTKHDQDCGPRGTRTYANRLLRADAEENVIGHIIIMESGGGQAIAVPEMTDAILKCKKPIVTWVDGMACSAAYYIASYTKEIIASRANDMIGCIGTMAMYEGRTAKSEANEDGERQVTIYADGSEEKNQEYEAAINDFDFTLIKQRFLNPLNEQFKADVSGNRKTVKPEQLKGRSYFASDCVGTLIDSIGEFSVAMDRIIALADFKPSKKSNSQNNQVIINSFIPMKKQFLNVNKVLNVEALEATEEGVFLNEDQLELVDNQIAQIDTLTSEHATAIENITAELATATETVTTMTAERDTARTELTNALDPFNAIDPSIASAATPEAKVQAIRTLLAAKPGTAPAQNLGGDDPITDETNWETIDNLPHNKLVDTNL